MPNVDIDIDMDVDSNGYYPIGRKKKFYQEFVSYDKTDGKYEEHHHCRCKGKHGYSKVFCKSKLFRTNYKKDDVFQVENEEMSCDDLKVTYDTLDKFFCQREEVDMKMKGLSFSTLIPPPVSSFTSHMNVCKVFVTELNVDFSCDFVSPSTIQDPVYVNFDIDALQVQLDNPYLDNLEHIRFRWQRNCLLTSLVSIMKGYGETELSQSFTTFYHQLLGVCQTASSHNGDAEYFYEIFHNENIDTLY